MGRRGARRGLAASRRRYVGRDSQGVARERRGAANVREKVRGGGWAEEAVGRGHLG